MAIKVTIETIEKCIQSLNSNTADPKLEVVPSGTGISIHKVLKCITISDLSSLLSKVNSVSRKYEMFIGTSGKDVVITAMARTDTSDPSSTKNNNKRKMDDTDGMDEKITSVLDKIKNCKESGKKIHKNVYDMSDHTMNKILKLRSCDGEGLVVDTWSFHVTKPNGWGHPRRDVDNNVNERHGIVIGVRFVGGVPIKISQLLGALGMCKDGIITSNQSLIQEDFSIPQSDTCLQTCKITNNVSFLMFASVNAAVP